MVFVFCWWGGPSASISARQLAAEVGGEPTRRIPLPDYSEGRRLLPRGGEELPPRRLEDEVLTVEVSPRAVSGGGLRGLAVAPRHVCWIEP